MIWSCYGGFLQIHHSEYLIHFDEQRCPIDHSSLQPLRGLLAQGLVFDVDATFLQSLWSKYLGQRTFVVLAPVGH